MDIPCSLTSTWCIKVNLQILCPPNLVKDAIYLPVWQLIHNSMHMVQYEGMINWSSSTPNYRAKLPHTSTIIFKEIIPTRLKLKHKIQLATLLLAHVVLFLCQLWLWVRKCSYWLKVPDMIHNITPSPSFSNPLWFGTKSLVIFFWFLWWNLVWVLKIL